MKVAIEQFHENIARVHHLADLYTILSQKEPRLDSSGILRAEIVLAVSALDTFIHDLVRLGMLEILRGQRRQTEAYQTFKVSMHIIRFDANYDWFEKEIKRRHRFESFQNPRHITEALKLISKLDLWEQVANFIKNRSLSENNWMELLKDVIKLLMKQI